MPSVHSYIRVSTDKQAVTGGGVAAQGDSNAAYIRYLISCDDSLIEGNTYMEDGGVSASKTPFLERPAGVRALTEMERGDHIVFCRLDRCFRSVKDMVVTMPIFEDRGIVVHFTDLKVDTSSPAGKFMIQIMSAAAELESNLISARTKAAKRALAAKRNDGLPPEMPQFHISARGKDRKGPPVWCDLGYKVIGEKNGKKIFGPDKEKRQIIKFFIYKMRNKVPYMTIEDQVERILAQREGRHPIPRPDTVWDKNTRRVQEGWTRYQIKKLRRDGCIWLGWQGNCWEYDEATDHWSNIRTKSDSERFEKYKKAQEKLGLPIDEQKYRKK